MKNNRITNDTPPATPPLKHYILRAGQRCKLVVLGNAIDVVIVKDHTVKGNESLFDSNVWCCYIEDGIFYKQLVPAAFLKTV